MAQKTEEAYLDQRNRLRDEFDQAGRPGGDFYTWLMNRVESAMLKEKVAKEKWKTRKWKKKSTSH